MHFLFSLLLLSLFGAGSLYASEPDYNKTPAKKLFGARSEPSRQTPQSIGGYVGGCLAGGKKLSINGPAWQAMRLSRNRNWGHPELVKFIERLAIDAQKYDNWPGLLVGDLAQPRGGPMLTGHRSHQIGLDGDIWLMPMPKRVLNKKEREKMSAISVIKNKKEINPEVWTEEHAKLLRRAASYPELARIFVNPVIKKELCHWSKDHKRKDWMSKIRPWWGHHYHFHVRLKCPKGSAGCKNQPAPKPGDGCGADLAKWFKPPPKPKKVVKPVKKKPRREIMLSALPQQCRAVLDDNQSSGKQTPVPTKLQ